jgi:hypothetical protein
MVSRALPRSLRNAPSALAAAEPAAPRRVVADATEAAVPRFVGAVAVVLPAGLLVQALIDHASYRHPVVPVVVWLGMLAVAVWLVPRVRAGELSNAHAAVAVLVAVAAVTAIGLDRRVHGAAGQTLDWTILGTVWLLALIALSRPAWLWVPGSALVMGIHAVFVLRAQGLSPLGLTHLAASGYAVVSILAVFAALRPALRLHAEMVVRRAALASRSAAERAAADAIGEVRRGRLALLETEALPLLRGIAGGTLDPADTAVRGQCAQHAATLRRALVDRALQQQGGLLADLQPVLSAAQARDVPVEVQVIGDPGRPGQHVVRAVRAAVDDVLRVLPPQQAILTVVADGDSVELFLTFERPPAAGCDVAGLGDAVPAEAGWRAALEVEDTGHGCLEVHWRKPVPV